MKKNVRCPFCLNILIESEIKGYSYQCLKCDEDFYKVEVTEKNEKEIN